MKISKKFLYPSIFLFNPDFCVATQIQDQQEQTTMAPQATKIDEPLTQEKLENLCLDLEKLRKTPVVYTSLEHFIKINAPDKNSQASTIIVFKNFTSSVKIRSIFFEEAKPGVNEIHNLDMVFNHLIKAALIKFYFDPEKLTLRLSHLAIERSKEPKIVNDFHLLIQMKSF